MNRDQRIQAFRDGQLAPEQPSISMETVPWTEMPRTADGFVLAADLGSLLFTREEDHERDLPTGSWQVLACRPDANHGLRFKSYAVISKPGNSRPTPPPPQGPSPAAATGSGEQASQQPQPAQAPSAKALARTEAASGSSGPVMPTEQLKLPSGVSALQAQMDKDKDTRLVHEILLAKKRGLIRTHQDLDRRLKRAKDEIRVRRMVAEIEPHDLATSTRRGPVSWGDVEGISGYLPFENPVMVVGEIREVSTPSGSPGHSTIKVRVLRAMLPADLKDLEFFKVKITQPVELHVESSEVGLRLAQFWPWGAVRLKVIISRTVPRHGHWRGTVSEVYPESLSEADRQARVDWVIRELARVPPDKPEWVGDEAAEAQIAAEEDEPE